MSSRTSLNINPVIRILKNGALRFTVDPIPNHRYWFPSQMPGCTDETLADWDLTDFETAIGAELNEAVEAEFNEEIKVIAEALKAQSAPSNRKTNADAFKQEFNNAIHLKSMALNYWNAHAIPLRIKSQMVCKIWPPRDISGKPNIKWCPLDVFVSLIAQKTAQDTHGLKHQQKQLRRWKLTAIVSSLALVAAVILSASCILDGMWQF